MDSNHTPFFFRPIIAECIVYSPCGLFNFFFSQLPRFLDTHLGKMSSSASLQQRQKKAKPESRGSWMGDLQPSEQFFTVRSGVQVARQESLSMQLLQKTVVREHLPSCEQSTPVPVGLPFSLGVGSFQLFSCVIRTTLDFTERDTIFQDITR